MIPTLTSTSRFSTSEASSLVAAHYGMQVTAACLPGECDQNFYLCADDGREFVLRVSHAQEQRSVLEMQNQVLAHLAEHAPEITLQRVCPSLTGEKIVTITGSGGATLMMRLLTWVPGKLLAHCSPHTPQLLHSLGSTLGRIDRFLLNFQHPAAHRELKWDLRRAGWIRDELHQIAETERRALVERRLQHFENHVQPRLASLRASVIYNDANDYNVLVAHDEPAVRLVKGVIDFGDLLHSNTICELAIGAAYAMLDKPDPLSAAASVVAGYHAELPLTEAELELLFPLICMRLCVSVTNSACQKNIEPDNHYLLISERPAWQLLERLETVNPQLAHFAFRHACGLPPSPTSPRVASWLADSTDKIGKLVEPALTPENIVVHDLSVGSLEISNPAEAADVRLFTEKLFAGIQAAGARTGIGRYNEARALYTSDIFRTEGDNGPEWRTVHLGLDLFQPAGSPVYAPLAGKIHSFALNAGELDYGPTIVLEHQVASEALTFYTLYGHLREDSLSGLYEGKPVSQGDCIGHIGDYPLNGNWPPHLHFQIITDLLGRKGDFPGVALPTQRDVWLSLSPDPNLITKIPAELLAVAEPEAETILAQRRQHTGRNLSISYRRPLHIVRGWMQHLYDADGRAYLDAVNNVPHVGHCHPRVATAAQRQMAVLNTNSRYLHKNLVQFAERLCATLPEPLRVCFFVNSGSEANELALRLARTHTGSRETIAVEVGYHGNTGALIEISSYKHAGPGGTGAPPFVHVVPMPDVYRGQYKSDDPQAGAKYAQYVAAAVNDIHRQGRQTGAFIAESILSCGGQIVLPDGYLSAAYQHVRSAGGVCIADEVQTGLGRVGSHFWTFETQQVIPDIVTIGKPIGNGHPLGVVVTTPAIAASFDNGMEYFNTFGGNPVSCAVGLAVLDVIEAEGLQANALRVGHYLMSGLRDLMNRHHLPGDVRGLGLFIGIELVQNRESREPAPEQAAYIANRMRECGVLLSTDGPFHNVLKIKPPLVFNQTDADFLLITLARILSEDFLHT